LISGNGENYLPLADSFAINVSSSVDEENWQHEIRNLRDHFFLLNQSETCSLHTELKNVHITDQGALLLRLQDEPDFLFQHDAPFCIFSKASHSIRLRSFRLFRLDGTTGQITKTAYSSFSKSL